MKQSTAASYTNTPRYACACVHVCECASGSACPYEPFLPFAIPALWLRHPVQTKPFSDAVLCSSVDNLKTQIPVHFFGRAHVDSDGFKQAFLRGRHPIVGPSCWALVLEPLQEASPSGFPMSRFHVRHSSVPCHSAFPPSLPMWTLLFSLGLPLRVSHQAPHLSHFFIRPSQVSETSCMHLLLLLCRFWVSSVSGVPSVCLCACSNAC